MDHFSSLLINCSSVNDKLLSDKYFMHIQDKNKFNSRSEIREVSDNPDEFDCNYIKMDKDVRKA
jgi:hypothetical protein